MNSSGWISKLPSSSRGRDDTEPGFVLPQAYPAQHGVFIFDGNHELAEDLIHSPALAVVMAVIPKRDTELE